MKSIAILTMIVLPGTFLSTLFAMPLFNWDAEAWSEVAKPRFWIYWAITVPLTIMTITTWQLWQRWRDRKNVKLDAEARERADSGAKKEV
jgi:O-antigen/teichoic acid export membrane protein